MAVPSSFAHHSKICHHRRYSGTTGANIRAWGKRSLPLITAPASSSSTLSVVRRSSNGDTSSFCPPEVQKPLQESFDRAVSRARSNPYPNSDGFINLAECGIEMDDQIEMDDDEIISVFIREVGTLFGQGGVEAEAVTEGETRGFVRMRLSPFLENPATYDSEVEKWCQEMELFESLLETYRLLLLPGALTGEEEEPGTFWACPLGRSEDVLLTGIDRLQSQLLSKKLLHGRW